MGNLFKYASLTTKIRAMSGDLISIDGFKSLCECDSISSAMNELMKYKYYKDAFKNVDVSTLHREDIEQILMLSSLEEFMGLYKFTSGTPRKYLNLVSMYNELYVLKRILRDILSNRPKSLNLKFYAKHIGAHMDFNIDDLLAANDIQQFIETLKNTEYYNCLNELYSKGGHTIFEYGLALDTYYFDICFKFAAKELKGTESKDVLSILGTRCDFLNMQWIYRTKKYYNVKSADLYATLIPHYSKLSVDEIKQMAESEDVTAFFEIFEKTYYGKLEARLFKNKPGLEEIFMSSLEYLYTQNKKRDPYSLATLSYYLYARELEISRVTKIIESIRYALPAEDIITTILKLETRRSFA
jgi:ATP synthase, subunit C